MIKSIRRRYLQWRLDVSQRKFEKAVLRWTCEMLDPDYMFSDEEPAIVKTLKLDRDLKLIKLTSARRKLEEVSGE